MRGLLLLVFGTVLTAAGAHAQYNGQPYKPPSPDPRDIAGAYQPQMQPRLLPVEGGEPPFNAAGRALFDKRVAAAAAGKPEASQNSQCLPHGVPLVIVTTFPLYIYQVPGEVLFLHEIQHLVRHVYMDEDHPADLDPSFMGHQVGRWDGDTLVIDTVGQNDKATFLDPMGTPRSGKIHVVERWKKISGGRQLEVLVTIDDPVYYTRPWTARLIYDWSPNIRQMEYVCQENNRNPPGADGATTVIGPGTRNEPGAKQ